MIAMSAEDTTGHVVVVFRWSAHLGKCYDCGAPAAFWVPNKAVDHESPTAAHDTEKRCAVCAANEAAEGVRIFRIEPLD